MAVVQSPTPVALRGPRFASVLKILALQLVAPDHGAFSHWLPTARAGPYAIAVASLLQAGGRPARRETPRRTTPATGRSRSMKIFLDARPQIVFFIRS